ncbi:hypothetical protein E2562_007110 [Oryza meyeriana var. granulata]|uniref:F-box associated domain-containing protein n=1 Tax=Oryza meyeriana var. granulata TaxID=110450 RepID=A0A6G1F4X9_9ORYZ|nr:hypothetical protein E2562_007110 [Oryza meyeriana var. granulata]
MSYLRSPACTHGGAFYWFIDEYQPCALLRFSLRDNTFDVVPCPLGSMACHFDDYMTDLAGELCYVHHTGAESTTFDV